MNHFYQQKVNRVLFYYFLYYYSPYFYHEIYFNQRDNVLKLNDGGKTYNIDHNDDLRGGGSDEDFNKSWEEKEDNARKGAVRIEAW